MLEKLAGAVLRFRVWTAAVALVVVAGGVMLARPAPADAHCDSVNGPVVTAARQALTTGNVKLVLAYVQPEYETELTAAFKQTLEVRKMGPKGQELADHYFFETAVRLHRTGEGAAYTGLNEETDHGPALAAADKALETGSLDGVYTVLDKATRDGVASKYKAVQAARLEAVRKGTLTAQRERAEAELIFEKYVYELHQAALGQPAAAEGAQPPAAAASTGHTH